VFSFSSAFRALGPAATWRVREIYGLPSDLRNANRQLPSVSELLIAATAICSLNSVYPPPLSAGDVTESAAFPRVANTREKRTNDGREGGRKLGDEIGTDSKQDDGFICLPPARPAPLFCKIVPSRGRLLPSRNTRILPSRVSRAILASGNIINPPPSLVSGRFHGSRSTM